MDEYTLLALFVALMIAGCVLFDVQQSRRESE